MIILISHILYMILTIFAVYCCYKKEILWGILFLILAHTQLTHHQSRSIMKNQKEIINLLNEKIINNKESDD